MAQEILTSPPCSRTITANEPILLTDLSRVWQVKSGKIVVLVAPFDQGKPVGQRRYLFTVEAGEALFNSHICQVTHLGLLAVAVEPAEVRPIPLCENDETLLPTNTLKQMIDPWIHHLGQVEGMPKTAQTGIVPDTHYISLTRGQVCRPPEGDVSWVRMQQGSACWMGNPNFPLMAELGCFPLGYSMFLQAQDHLEFFIRPTAEVKYRKILIRGLKQLHSYCFSTMEHIEDRRQRQSLRRFQQRQQLNREVTQKVVNTLAGVLNQDHPFEDIDDPLLAAAGAVGKALGVTIHPPAASENAARTKEPLEAIARASQLRRRRVLLRGKWWQQDSGPLVAYTRDGHQPVALLPVKGNRYELLSPMGISPIDSTKAGEATINSPLPQGDGPDVDVIDSRLVGSAHPTVNQGFGNLRGLISADFSANQPEVTPAQSSRGDLPNRLMVTESLARSLDPVAFIF